MILLSLVMYSINSSSFFVIDVTSSERLFNRISNWVRSQGQTSFAKPAQGNKFSAKAAGERISIFYYCMK